MHYTAAGGEARYIVSDVSWRSLRTTGTDDGATGGDDHNSSNTGAQPAYLNE
jgi:hypothetical protein